MLTIILTLFFSLFSTEQMMREFCEEAVKYGDMPISPKAQPTHMTVILNPVAKKRYYKYYLQYVSMYILIRNSITNILELYKTGKRRNYSKNIASHFYILLELL